MKKISVYKENLLTKDVNLKKNPYFSVKTGFKPKEFPKIPLLRKKEGGPFKEWKI